MSKTSVKAHLPKPLERPLNSEEIVSAERGQPLVKLASSRPSVRKRTMGFAKFTVEANFDERIIERMEFEWRESAKG